MERLIMEQLIAWKHKRNRKPLMIRGARQVGKTWVMKEFGRRYFENVVYISFDNNEHLKNVFSMDFDIQRIFPSMHQPQLFHASKWSGTLSLCSLRKRTKNLFSE